jgi:hypothetical protein
MNFDYNFVFNFKLFNSRFLKLSELFSFFSNKKMIDRKQVILGARSIKEQRVKKMNKFYRFSYNKHSHYRSFNLVYTLTLLSSFYRCYFFTEYYLRLYSLLCLDYNQYFFKKFLYSTTFDFLVFFFNIKKNIKLELFSLYFISSLTFYKFIYLAFGFKTLTSIFLSSNFFFKKKLSLFKSNIKYIVLQANFSKIKKLSLNTNSSKFYLFKLMFKIFRFRMFLFKKVYLFKCWLNILSKIKFKNIFIRKRYAKIVKLYSFILNFMSQSSQLLHLFSLLKKIQRFRSNFLFENQFQLISNKKFDISFSYNVNYLKTNTIFWTQQWLSGALTNFYGLKNSLKKNISDFNKLKGLPEFVMLLHKPHADNFINEIFNLDIPFFGLSSLQNDPYFFQYYVPSNTSDKDLLYFYFVLILEAFLRAHIEEVNRVV